MVARVAALEPDHVLITGRPDDDGLAGRVRGGAPRLADLLADPAGSRWCPATTTATRPARSAIAQFEEWLRRLRSAGSYPWLRRLDAETAILGLDPTRSHISARGPARRATATARALLADPATARGG